MVKGLRIFFLMLILCFFSGCATKIPHVVVSEYAKRDTRLIAVMPVQSKPADQKTAEMLRGKLIEALYFKGYPRVPPRLVDDRLAIIYAAASGVNPSPLSVGEMLKVDAVLYTTLKEGSIGRSFIYVPTTVDAEFEMRSAKTGESLWRVQYRIVYRHYGFSRKQLELKASQVYEPAIEEVVTKALSTLPDGPDAGGT